MNTLDRPARWAGIAFDIGFTLVAALGVAFTAYMISDSWGGRYAVFDAVAAAVVCGLALARRVNRAWTAIAGLAVAAVAILVSQIANLPQEPGPITSLALAVLIGSAIRTLPAPWAGGIAAGGLAVILGCWLTGGFRAVAIMGTMAWVGAVVLGWSLRRYDAGRRAAAESRRAAELDHANWVDRARTS
jgi:hypothetical protein